MHPILDPVFYLAAVPAVILYGLAKGGFGGAIGMMAVPLMSLVMSPIQAAAILLPVLVVMDVVSIYAYRGVFDAKSLKLLIPAGILGLCVGWATAAYVNEAEVRLLIGVISILFVLDHLLGEALRKRAASSHNPPKAVFWGTIAGFTSFVSHSGGPPFQLYMVPLHLAPRIFVGTSALFFFSMNVIKLFPYFMLGEFDTSNLSTSVVLFPLAILSTFAGVWLIKVINQKLFYRLIYLFMAIVGAKLVWDGLLEILT